MSKTHRFASVSGKPFVYFVHGDSMALFDQAYRSVGPLGARFGYAATYGDGLTQHEAERPVCKGDLGMVVDYVTSLAAFVTESTLTDEGERRELQWVWPESPSRAAIEFALSVKHKSTGPYRYFNLLDRKISGRSDLQHDKRWHKITEFHDGTVSSALGVLASTESCGVQWVLERWVISVAVNRIAGETGRGEVIERELFGVDYEGVRPLTNAFELAEAAFGAMRAQLEAERPPVEPPPANRARAEESGRGRRGGVPVIPYKKFRTGLTYRDVYMMLWSPSEERSTWRHKRRGSVLGLWRSIKLELYDRYVGEWQDAANDNGRENAA